MQRVAIYVRMSKDVTHSGAGVARQERECRELVAQHSDWEVAAVFSDNDLSAFSGAPRPGYDALLEAIENRAIDIVVCWHSDRLYRRVQDLERFIAVCQPANVPTYAVQAGPLDLSTASGRMVARTLGAVSQYESEQKGARHRAANRQRARKGHVHRTRRCFGYELDGTIREEEAQAIREGAHALLNGSSLASVARKWNRAQLPPPQGKRRTPKEKADHAEAVEKAIAAGEEPPPLPPLRPSEWVSSSVRLTLRAPRLAGLATYKGEIVRDEDTGQPIEAEWPGILERSEWYALQRRLEEIASERRFPSGERQLLSGLAVCADCGSPLMSGGTRNGRRRYRCRQNGSHVYREAEPIDNLVEQLVLARLKRPDARALLSPSTTPADTNQVQREIEDLDSRQADLALAYAKGDVTLAQMTAANRAMDTERSRLLHQLPAPTNPLVGSLLDDEDIDRAWSKLDADAKRSVIDALMVVEVLAPGTKENAYLDWKKRIINPETVRVTWK